MINVPEKFRPRIKVEYPQDNKQIFEEWFYDNCTHVDNPDRTYIPVFWTSYYVNNNYGNDKQALSDLQDFINSLDKSKKYFTIVQYDDGILNDLSGIDIKVFGMGGGRIDYPLPLLCMPHPHKFENNRDIFAFFQGSMTHEIRRQMVSVLRCMPDYVMPRGTTDCLNFCGYLSRSVFALCPRGYGETSFRICEALQYGAIPVYISDKHIIPHGVDFNLYGVMISANDQLRIDDILRSISPEEIKAKQEKGKEVYRDYYSFESNLKLILQKC